MGTAYRGVRSSGDFESVSPPEPERKPIVYGDEGVIDLVDGAILAYGTRRINSVYGKPAMRVRRDSDGKERNIHFGEDNWLRVDHLLEFAGSASVYTKKVFNQIRNFGRPALQEDNAKQPRIVDSGTLETDENGNPVIRFLPGTYLDVPSFSTTVTRTCIIVFEYNGTPASATELFLDGKDGDRSVWGPHSGGDYIIATGEAGGGADGVAVVPVDNDRHYHLITWGVDCWEHITSVDGEGGAITVFTAAQTMSDLRIGASQGGSALIDASLQMLALWPKRITSSRVRQVEIQTKVLKDFDVGDTVHDSLVCS